MPKHPIPDLETFLNTHPVFRREELKAWMDEQGLTTGGPTLRGWLNHRLKIGCIQSVKAGLYVVSHKVGSDDSTDDTPYLIAGRSAKDAVIAYGSALAWHAKGTVPVEIHLISKQLTRFWLFGTRTFRPVKSTHGWRQEPPPSGILKEVCRGLTVRVTSRERTLVDLLDRPDLAGGLQNTWKELPRLFPVILDRVLACLHELNCRVTNARVGYFLSAHLVQLGMDPKDLEVIGSIAYPIPDQPYHWAWKKIQSKEDCRDHKINRRWNLIVPPSIPQLAPVEPKKAEGAPEPSQNPTRLCIPDRIENISLLRLLETNFGYLEFRPGQEAIIRRALAGLDTIAILPTGSGKSLTYFMPSLLLNGQTLVISPLISLIEDQVSEATLRGIPAIALNSNKRSENLPVLKAALHGNRHGLVFMAPESWKKTFELLPELKSSIRQIVVDEAHLIHSWGNSTFRPAYARLGDLRRACPQASILALTATARPKVQQAIRAVLEIPKAELLSTPTFRPNLYLATQEVQKPAKRSKGSKRVPGQPRTLFEARFRALAAFIKSQDGAYGIVYCPSIKILKKVTSKLSEELGLGVKPFYAGMSPSEKSHVLQAFKTGTGGVQIVVATVAFGMGINKPDVRFVVHFGLPMSLDGYAQEIGRAGRDGEWAECLLIFSKGELSGKGLHKRKWANQESFNFALEGFGYMKRWLLSEGCRHQALSEAFGDSMTNCKSSCERCNQPKDQLVDVLGTQIPILRPVLDRSIRDVQPEGASDIPLEDGPMGAPVEFDSTDSDFNHESWDSTLPE